MKKGSLETATKKGDLIDRGQSAEVFMWEDRKVCKLYYKNIPLDWIQREAMVNRLLSASEGLSVPKFFGEVEIEGRKGHLYEYIKGPSILAVLMAKPWKVRKLGRLMAEVHSAMHQHRIPELPSLQEFIAERIPVARLLSDPQKKKVSQALRQLPDDDVLCHFEFHPQQILMSTRGPVTIDWVLAHRGHPLADVARTLIMLQTSPVPPFVNKVKTLLINMMRMAFAQTYLRHYLTLNPGITQAQVDAWMLPVAAQRLGRPEAPLTNNPKAEESEFTQLLNIVENLL